MKIIRCIWPLLLPGIFLANTAFAANSNTRVVAYNGKPITESTRNVRMGFFPTRSIGSNGNFLVHDSWGILIDEGGVLRYLAETGTTSPLPGETYNVSTGADYGILIGDYPAGDGSAVYIMGSEPSGRTLLIADRNGSKTVLALTGQVAPDVPGRTFANIAVVPGLGFGKYIATSDAGDVAFLVELDSGNTDNDVALYYEDGNGNVNLVAREGVANPGLPAGTSFAFLEKPLLAGPGIIVFNATLKQPDGQLTEGIWRARVASGCMPLTRCLENLIMQGDPVPGIGGESLIEGIQRPNPAVNAIGGISFTFFFIPKTNEPQETAIFMSSSPSALPGMVYRSGPGVDAFKPVGVTLHSNNGTLFLNDVFGNPNGIKIWKNGRISTLIQNGDVPAGLPAGVSLTGGAGIAVNHLGQIAMFARLQGPGVSRENNGIFIGIQGLGQPMEVVFREGDSFPVAGGDCTLPEISMDGGTYTFNGYRRVFNDQGKLLWWSSGNGDTCTSNNVLLMTTFGPPVPPPPDLVALEVVQSVQDWNNSVVLVEGKKTFVHAHFQATGGGNISPRLRAFRNAVELPGGPLVPDNPGARVPLSQNAAASRGAINRRARFTLPPGWTSGTVTYEVTGGSDPINCEEPSGLELPDCEVIVSFETAEKPQIKFWNLAWAAGPVQHTVNQALTKDLVGRLISAYPVSAVNWRYQNSSWPGFLNSPPDSNQFSDVIASLVLRRKKDNCSTATNCKDIYYAMVATNGLEGQADDIPSSVAISFVPSNPVAQGRQTHTHELGHTLGLPHSVDSGIAAPAGTKKGWCGSQAADTAPDFKYLNLVNGRIRPTLGPMFEGDVNLVYGYDSKQQLLVDPYRVFDMMSYCSSSPIDFWPSEDTYRKLKLSIDTRFKVTSALQAGLLVAGDFMVIRGIVDLQGPTATLLPVAVAEDILPPDNPPVGDFTLRLRSGTDALLNEISFEVKPTVVRGSPGSRGHFAVSVPVDAAIRKIEILHGGLIIASAQASDNAPVINITTPTGGQSLNSDVVALQWTATDQDGDDLFFDVQYSRDGGGSWNTLETDYMVQSLEIPRSQLPASGNALLRVSASDGFNVTTAQTATLTVANNPPVVFIDSPVDGTLFVGGQTIYLAATAIDPEDLFLQSPAFAWSSDLDGPQGSGNPLLINASTLQDGEHTITVTAQDNDAAEGTAQVTIRVSQVAPDQLADLELRWLTGLPAFIFGNHTLNLRLVNNGPESAENVTLDLSILNMPGDVGTLQSVTIPDNWNCTGFHCTIPILEVDEEALIEVHVQLLQGTPRLDAITASTIIDPATGNNVAAYILAAIPDPGAVFRDSFE